jgi:hypothetical protein
MGEERERAWVTRREKYGPRGHGSSYSRSARTNGLLDLVIRLHVEGVLSEGQVAKASGLGRVEIRRLADMPTPTPSEPTP